MSAVEKFVPQEVIAVPAQRSTMDMVQEAVMRGASMELIEKLMALHERWEASQGRKAFDQAIADAKAEIPVILKKRKGHNGKYEDMAAIADAVAPILSKFGLSYRYRADQTEKMVTVTCIVSHRDGYYEETKLVAPPDNTGNKNHIQAIASTLTYLQRHSLKLALGLAAGQDDDGQAAGKVPDEPISEAQVQQLIDLADDVGASKERFCKYMKVESFASILAKDFDRARKELEAKRQKAMAHA